MQFIVKDGKIQGAKKYRIHTVPIQKSYEFLPVFPKLLLHVQSEYIVLLIDEFMMIKLMRMYQDVKIYPFTPFTYVFKHHRM